MYEKHLSSEAAERVNEPDSENTLEKIPRIGGKMYKNIRTTEVSVIHWL